MLFFYQYIKCFFFACNNVVKLFFIEKNSASAVHDSFLLPLAFSNASCNSYIIQDIFIIIEIFIIFWYFFLSCVAFKIKVVSQILSKCNS